MKRFFANRWALMASALLLALIIHSTMSLTAAIILWRAERRRQPDNVPDSDRVGHLTVHRSPRLFVDPLRYSARLTSCLAVPLLLVPVFGNAGLWAALAVWTGALWLAAAIVWKERGSFPAFQAVLTWAAVLLGYVWVERQD